MSNQDSHHGRSFQRGLQEGVQRTTGFGRFGQLFPQLKALVADNDALKVLADTMRDDATTSALTSNNQNIPAGYTYLGQFIDHDITLDVTPLGAHENDPNAVVDFRTPRLDLDSVYGSGPPRHRTSTTASIRTSSRSDDAPRRCGRCQSESWFVKRPVAQPGRGWR